MRHIFLSGGITTSRDWVNELQSAFGMQMTLWNPFDVVSVADHVDLAELEGQESRFTAAVGAALGTFEEDR